MPRPISLLVLPLALSSLVVQAQTAPQLASVLERLDRLEQENRSLTEQVQALRGELAAFRGETPTASNGTTTVANETPLPILNRAAVPTILWSQPPPDPGTLALRCVRALSGWNSAGPKPSGEAMCAGRSTWIFLPATRR